MVLEYANNCTRISPVELGKDSVFTLFIFCLFLGRWIL